MSTRTLPRNSRSAVSGREKDEFPDEGTILIIDDNEELLENVSLLLSSKGYDTIVAQTGTKGLSLAMSKSPDLVICDISMPDMNGFTVYKTLEKYGATTNMAFIFLTGLGDMQQVRRGMGMGVDDYIVKPFKPRDLIDSVRVHLRKKTRAMESVKKEVKELREGVLSAIPDEMTTLLDGVVGSSDFLRTNWKDMDDVSVSDLLTNIQSSGRRLKKLSENLKMLMELRLSRLEEEQGSTDTWAAIPASQVVRQVCQAIAEKHGRTNSLQFDLDDVKVKVKASHLVKIISEVIESAFRGSTPDSKISVKLIARPVQDEAILEVVDEGSSLGIQDWDSEEVVAQFDRTIIGDQEGGLGLAIVRELLEKYGGMLMVSAGEANGSVVRMIMPTFESEKTVSTGSDSAEMKWN